MKMRNFLSVTSVVLCLSVIFFTSLSAQINYLPPSGEWTYTYEGDKTASDDLAALDSTWMHDNNSDSWDGDEIGGFNPGGVNLLTDGSTSYVRMQDTGDPREYGFIDPSNRKMSFIHFLDNDGLTGAEAIVDDGVTLAFRTRVATGDPLDEVHPDGGAGIASWPAEGNGYLVHDGGLGNFSIRQSSGGYMGFALAMKTDHEILTTENKQGLVMNTTNGKTITGDVGIDQGGTLNIVEIEDPTVWHEFWITIVAGGLAGTHSVQVWVDGATYPQSFEVTIGGGDPGAGETSYLQLGVGNTAQDGAFDVDYFSYKNGVHTPQIKTGVLDDVELPQEFALYNNYPNPFNPKTEIRFYMKQRDQVNIAVYDALGQLVETLFNGVKSAGIHSVAFDAAGHSSGVYFYRMVVSDKIFNKKMLLIK